jgi:hypothetical protein
MLIVLSNRQEGKDMPEHHDTETTTVATERDGGATPPGPTPSQLAAVVEAAYILEAVRK